MTRYVIIGAGAVGGTIGARLALAGIDTVWVARGEHGRALRERGLTLLTPDDNDTVPAPVWLDPTEAELTADDVLVVAVKTHQVAEALATWADLPVRLADGSTSTAGESLPVIMATNGVAAETIAQRWFARVFGMSVWAPTVNLDPGVVIARFTPVVAVLHCSRVPAALTTDADRELLAELSRTWGGTKMTIPLPDDVMPWKYRKLLTNIGNVVQALVGSSEARDVVRAADAEAREVIKAAGIDIVDDETEAAQRRQGPKIAEVPGGPEKLGGSTWQSLAKGRGSVETDYLNGEITAIAHATGQRAPLNTTLARLGRQAAATGAQPGDLSAAELREILGLPPQD
ncbi:ketopantoate reductase family protein [Enemella sp. A6]|uniref:ketopantoate reductase family protein n=1 Tax=Enemella sp. A6 TaxID=3440152 RepID=UPI003EBC5812